MTRPRSISALEVREPRVKSSKAPEFLSRLGDNRCGLALPRLRCRQGTSDSSTAGSQHLARRPNLKGCWLMTPVGSALRLFVADPSFVARLAPHAWPSVGQNRESLARLCPLVVHRRAC